MEELESLEETVNESIQESVGARSGKGFSKKKPVFEDEEDDFRYSSYTSMFCWYLHSHLRLVMV